MASVTIKSFMKVLDIPKSGKRGNTVWQRNRYGQYGYPAFIPYNPRTTAQVAVRGTFGAVSARWRELTEEQRILWGQVARTKKLTWPYSVPTQPSPSFHHRVQSFL